MTRQKGFESNPATSPRNWQYTMKLGKVIAVYPEKKTVDVVLQSGGVQYGVKVLATAISTMSGISYLPRPHLEKEPGENGADVPKAFGKRDIYAVIGFIEGHGSMPVVIGFMSPWKNQLSFPYKGYENQRLERHESDRYRRIKGDTAAALGGKDIPAVEEIRYPDNSYMRIYPDGESKALEDISQGVADKDATPFMLKKEERKGFYFQHASGTAVLIDPDGQIKLSHHTGTWLSIAPDTGDVARETVTLPTVDSEAAPPSIADASATQIHLEHSSGTKLTIKANGDIEVVSVGQIDMSASGDVNISSGGNTTVDADGDVTVTAGGGAAVNANGNATITSAGNIAMSGARIDLN